MIWVNWSMKRPGDRRTTRGQSYVETHLLDKGSMSHPLGADVVCSTCHRDQMTTICITLTCVKEARDLPRYFSSRVMGFLPSYSENFCTATVVKVFPLELSDLSSLCFVSSLSATSGLFDRVHSEPT